MHDLDYDPKDSDQVTDLKMRVRIQRVLLQRKERKMQQEYREFTIGLKPNMEFEIIARPDHPNDPSWQRGYSSFQDAKDDIDKFYAAAALEAKAAAGVAIQMLNSAGEKITVKGIHSGHGVVLSDPPLARDGGYSTDYVYPVSSAICALLMERQTMKKRDREINVALKGLGVVTKRYHGRIDPKKYPELMDDLTKEIDRARIEAATRFGGKREDVAA